MKTEFEFHVTLGHAALPEPIRIGYNATGKIATQSAGGVTSREVNDLAIEITLQSDSSAERWNSALLRITMPGRADELDLLARQLASDIAESMTFYYSEFHLDTNLVSAKALPETPEEALEVGDKPYRLQFSLQEVGEPPVVDVKHLRSFIRSIPHRRILQQYNAGQRAKSPIDAYLNMFKVLETVAHEGRTRARDALQGSAEVREALRQSFQVRSEGETEFSRPDDTDVDRLIDDLVRIRDGCAHLRERNAFGFAPNDAAVYEEVQPLYLIVADAARRLLQARLSDSGA